MKYGVLNILTASIISINAYAASGLQSLDDSELSESVGQSLLYMGTTLGSTVDSTYSNYKYYKMGFQADVSLNMNVKTLQLGCGGANGEGACDIDIENLSLTGVPTSVKSDGTPQWNYSGAMNGTELANERAASSAVLRNPFVEFAIKNPDDLALREVAGVRLSAEGIKGYMTAGTFNNTASGPDSNKNQGGIKTFSGYIITAPVEAAAMTAQSKFGTTEDQKIFAPVFVFLDKAVALGITLDVNLKARRTAYTDVAGMTNNAVTPPTGFSQWGINIAPLAVNFDFPTTVVTGNRMSQLNLKVDDVPINQIVVSAADGPIYMALDRTVQAGVAGTLAGFDSAITNSTFFMGKSGTRALTVVDPSKHATLTSTAQQENLRLARILFDTGYANNTSNKEENNIRAAYAALAGVPVSSLPANLNGTLTTQQQNWLLQAASNHMGCVTGGSGGSISVNVGSCTTIDNLAANVAVKQDFVRMHNLPVATTKTSGTMGSQTCTQANPCYDFNNGFYLSLQKDALRWPGSSKAYVMDPQTGNKKTVSDTYVGQYYVVDSQGQFLSWGTSANTALGQSVKQEFINPGDVAQRGWWMSFSEPLNFGKLEVQKEIPMADVLPQVATFINNFFTQQATSDGTPTGTPLYAIAGETVLTSNTALYPNYDSTTGNVRLDYATTTDKNNSGIIGVVPKNQVILGPTSATAAAKGLPLYVPLGSINVQGVPAVMELSDLPLSNYQAVVSNCWGNLKFC